MSEPQPFDALYGSTWGDADPRIGGQCPVNVTLSVAELLILRDAHFALLREADRRPIRDDMHEWEYHEIRAGHFDTLAHQVAPELTEWCGYNRNPYKANR
jgi:hypothetical protein